MRHEQLKNERGYSLIELTISAFVGSIALLAVFSIYLASTRAFAESDTHAQLQRQGTLALEEMTRQIRSASPPAAGVPAITTVTCNGFPNSVQVTNAGGTYCYYAGAAGELCEYHNGACRNLLAGSLKPAFIMTQPIGGDARCLPLTAVAAGSPCLFVTAASNTVLVAFTVGDSAGTDPINALTFNSTVTCKGRSVHAVFGAC